MSVSREPSHTHNAAGLMAPAPIPAEIAELVVRIGKAEWGETMPLSASGHAASVEKSIRITLEEFGLKGPQPMHGLYVDGDDTIICHTGMSPNSAGIAQALTGAWNRLVADCEAQQLAASAETDDGDHKSSATERSDLTRDEQP